ncbi:MAG: TetR/AcrR family transcriptional regulator [Candidatus Heimdallarchaeota archaeon]|nr:TetR/AcrR family transcriptional regulator [Candidatus Heimdallarchaeota archaeon]
MWNSPSQEITMARELQRQETKRKILEAAKELFLSKSISSVSTEEIADKAEVSKGSVFHHWTNKETLVTAILEDIFEEFVIIFNDLLDELRNDPKNWEKYFRKEITKMYDIEQSNPNLMKFVLDYMSVYTPNFLDPESPIKHLIELMQGYQVMLVQMFEVLGIKERIEVKTMILFSILDGIILQLEFIPFDQKAMIPMVIQGVVEEIIDIVRFWKKKETK